MNALGFFLSAFLQATHLMSACLVNMSLPIILQRPTVLLPHAERDPARIELTKWAFGTYVLTRTPSP